MAQYYTPTHSNMRLPKIAVFRLGTLCAFFSGFWGKMLRVALVSLCANFNKLTHHLTPLRAFSPRAVCPVQHCVGSSSAVAY